MSKYDKTTKFYWLQLKEDFFEEDSIEWLEDQENGYKYSLFYLKLCLKSLKSNGVLVRKVGNMLVPYNNKKLAEMTRTPIDTVIVAMELLKGIGLIQVLENGELYLTQLENLVGSASKGALKKQQQRLLQKQKQELLPESGQKEDKCPPKIEIELELKDKDINKNINKKKKYGEYNHVLLTDKEYDSLVSEYGSSLSNELIVYLDEYIEMKGTKYKSCYLAIKKWVVKAVNEKKNNQYGTKQPVRKEPIPDWFNKEPEIKELTPEEVEEMKNFEKELKEIYK